MIKPVNNKTVNTDNTLIKKIIAISDVEGFDIGKSIPKACACTDAKCCADNECDACKDTDIYICGDLLDSTNSSYPKDKILKEKIYNLRNILKVINSTNINLILGNRDLNKIKCLVLNKLIENNNNLIKQFNSGDINFSKYSDLLKLVKNKDPWSAKMKNWYTFWAGGVGSGKNWKANPDYSDTPFLKRFNDIFGPDNSVGTMSAPLLLDTIPLELNVNNDSKTDDEKAFIVLAIFNSMLGEKTETETEILWPMESAKFCKGWLRQLLKKSKVCDYKIDKKNIYIFSHGGITYDLISKSNKLDNFKKELKSNKDLYNVITDADNLKGGYYSMDKNIENIIEDNKFKDAIIAINKAFEDSIDNIFKETELKIIPTDDMLFLLAMTAPLNCDTLNTKVTTPFSCNTIGKKSTEYFSPVQPGFPIMRDPKNNFFINNMTIYQIFGHKPIGFGTTVDLIENKNNNQVFLVILDTSNSFRGSSNNADSNESFNYLLIDDKGPEINSFIKYKFENIIPITNLKLSTIEKEGEGEKDKKIKKLHLENFYYSKENQNPIIIKNKIDNIKDNIKATNNKNINFHGKSGNNFIFSMNGTLYDRSLFNLDKYEFNNFLELKVPPQEGLKGGAYYDKYLKYKNKYLQLKNN
jgi:hypothetical protein